MIHRYRPHPRSRLLAKISLFGIIAIALFAVAACNRPTEPAVQQATAPPTSVSAPTRSSQSLPPTLAALADQGKPLRFDHLTPEAGLSQSVVLDFVQDDQGFLWMATQDGLNRYDGYEFKVFKDDPQSANSLKGNFVASIDKAPTGEIWIGTADGGLNRYDPPSWPVHRLSE